MQITDKEVAAYKHTCTQLSVQARLHSLRAGTLSLHLQRHLHPEQWLKIPIKTFQIFRFRILGFWFICLVKLHTDAQS